MGFYALLSGQFHSAYLMIVGALCCVLILLLGRRLDVLDEESLPYEYWVKTALYAPWLLWQVLLSNLAIARRVWTLDPKITPQMLRIPHELESAFGIATYANSITLTPGTVTIEIGKDQFLVHALTQDAADDLLGGDMHDRVKAIESGVQKASAS